MLHICIGNQMLKLGGTVWQSEMLRNSWKQCRCGLMRTYSFIITMRTDVDLLKVSVNYVVCISCSFFLLLSHTKTCNIHRVMKMTKLCKTSECYQKA